MYRVLNKSTPLSVSALLLMVLSFKAYAFTVTWPSSTAPCNTTVQACVNGLSTNSTLLIAANEVTAIGAVGAALILPRPITLEAAVGYRPVFPVGIGISSDPLLPRSRATFTVRIAGITLRDAAITLRSNQAECSLLKFYVERMRLLIDNSSGNSSSGIDFEGRQVFSYFQPSVHLEINDNEYRRRGGPGSFLRVDVRETGLGGHVSFNRVRIPDSIDSDYGIHAIASGGSSFSLFVTRNDIRGSFVHGGICAVSHGPLGSETRSELNFFHNVLTPTVWGVGTAICIQGGEDAFDMAIAHNTIVDFEKAIALTSRPTPAPSVLRPIQALVVGNLLAHNGMALVRDAIAAPPIGYVSNSNNLFFANGSNFGGAAPATAGAGTMFTDPLLYSRDYPYLRGGSPAIGRGLNLSSYTEFPGLDADGSRRLKAVAGGGPNTIDVGAYEYGDNWFNVRANAVNSMGNAVAVSHPSLDGLPAARLLTTPNFSRGLYYAESNSIFGVFYKDGSLRWSIFNQNPVLGMPIGAGYSLMTAAAGDGLFLHQVASPAPASAETILDNVATNNKPNNVIAITSNWNPTGAALGVYNNHNTALAYGAGGRWRIRNSDGAGVAAASAFNVYAQPPGPNAFRQVARASNIRPMLAGAETRIDNTRLDGVRCAELMVTPLSTFGNRRFDVHFDDPTQRWWIYSPDGMPDGAEFNVLFSPRQIVECHGSAP